MKFKVGAGTLRKAWEQVSPFASGRKVLPVLTMIKVDARGEELTLTATDVERGIELRLEGIEVEEAGEGLLPAKETLMLLRHIDPDDVVTIETPGKGINYIKRATLKFKDGEYHLPVFGALDEFPAIDFTLKNPIVIKVDGRQFAQALKMVMPFAETDRRYTSLDVMCFSLMPDGVFELVATDTYKLGLARFDGLAEVKEPTLITVPVSLLNNVPLVCSKEDEITLRLDRDAVVIEGSNWRLLARSTNVFFPDNYHKTIPDPSDLNVSLTFNLRKIPTFLQRVKVEDRSGGRGKSVVRVRIGADPQTQTIELLASKDEGIEEEVVAMQTLSLSADSGERIEGTMNVKVWFYRSSLETILNAVRDYPVKVWLRKRIPERKIGLMMVETETLPFKFIALLAALERDEEIGSEERMEN